MSMAAIAVRALMRLDALGARFTDGPPPIQNGTGSSSIDTFTPRFGSACRCATAFGCPTDGAPLAAA